MIGATECSIVLKGTFAHNNLSTPQTQRCNLGRFEPSIRENDVGRFDLRKITNGESKFRPRTIFLLKHIVQHRLSLGLNIRAALTRGP